MTSSVQDQCLWQRYRQGDRQALGLLAERYYRVLTHYGMKFMVPGQVVEDCIQDLFLQLWQNRQQINDTASVKHYLLKALRHHILQYHRSQNRYPTQDLDWEAAIPDEFDAETLLIQQESLQALTLNIRAQLDKLPPREREALYLRYYENLTVPEIAEVMQVNRQSVSNFLQKALLKIRNRWLETALTIFCIFFQKNLL